MGTSAAFLPRWWPYLPLGLVLFFAALLLFQNVLLSTGVGQCGGYCPQGETSCAPCNPAGAKVMFYAFAAVLLAVMVASIAGIVWVHKRSAREGKADGARAPPGPPTRDLS